MTVRSFERMTRIEQPREQVFEFFSNAANLNKLTPSWLQFETQTPQPITMSRGASIEYRLRLYGLPIKWLTEITEWQPPHRFVDVQKNGPYKLWVHEHLFEEQEGSTLMVDSVKYAVPGGLFEPLIHRLFVQRDVSRIFDYRAQRLGDIFRKQESLI